MLNSSPFGFSSPVFRYVWSKLKFFSQKIKIFDPDYTTIGVKMGRIKHRFDIPL
jgi:hypothetical protein